MKPPGAWFELSLTVAGLMVGMLVVMWVQRPETSCTLSLEAPRLLVLSREIDREHLAADLASANRIARRYIFSIANPGSTARTVRRLSSDARPTDRDEACPFPGSRARQSPRHSITERT